MRALLEVPRRFRKRDSNASSTASSKLEKPKTVNKWSTQTGSEHTLWGFSCFPHGVLEEQEIYMAKGSCLVLGGERKGQK